MLSNPAHTSHSATQTHSWMADLFTWCLEVLKARSNQKRGREEVRKKEEKKKASWHRLATLMKACLHAISVQLTACNWRATLLPALLCEKWQVMVPLQSCFFAKFFFARLHKQNLNLYINLFTWTDPFFLSPFCRLWISPMRILLSCLLNYIASHTLGNCTVSDHRVSPWKFKLFSNYHKNNRVTIVYW